MNGKDRILIVDDDESIRLVLSILLEEEGYVVDTAQNGEEAIAKSYVNLYNVAIVDWRLPDIEGTVLLGRLRETTPRMIKIMLTGFPSMKNAVDAVNARADAFFQKPADSADLINKISELLKLQREDKRYSEGKVAEYIRTRAAELKQNRKPSSTEQGGMLVTDVAADR
jgi:two-component system response regulator PilR (NtrC family)